MKLAMSVDIPSTPAADANVSTSHDLVMIMR